MSLQAFDPSNIANLNLWLDSSNQATLYQSGTRASPGAIVSSNADPVGLWLDLSGHNNDVSAASNKPAWATSAFAMPTKTGYGQANGGFLPAVSFTGSGSTATPLRSSSAFLTSAYSQAFTIFVVRAGEPAYAPAVFISDNNATPHFWGGCGNSTLQQSMGSASAGTIYASSGAQAGNADTAAIDSFTYDGVTLKASHNGRPFYRGYTGDVGFTGNNVTVGGYAAAVANGYTGYIGEVLIYNRALTQFEVGQVSAYLATKWQVAVPIGTQVVGLGNSLTIGYRAGDARRYPGGDWPAQFKRFMSQSGVDVSVVNLGISAKTTTQMIAAARAVGVTPHNDIYANHKRTLCNSVAVVWEITNDLDDAVNGVGNNRVSVFNNMRDYCLARKQEGFTVLVCTCLPRNTANSWFESSRLDINVAIRLLYNTTGSQTTVINTNTYTGGATAFADGVVDIGADPNIGQAFGTSGFWQSDGVHLSGATGYPYVAGLVAAAVLPYLQLPQRGRIQPAYRGR